MSTRHHIPGTERDTVAGALQRPRDPLSPTEPIRGAGHEDIESATITPTRHLNSMTQSPKPLDPTWDPDTLDRTAGTR